MTGALAPLLDAVEGGIQRRVPVEGVPLGMWPAADGKALYLTLAASGKVARLDLGTYTVTQAADVGRVADGIGWSGAQ